MALEKLQDYCVTGTALEGEFIVDDHAHMGPWNNFNVPEDGSAAAMVRSMDTLGIDITFCSPHIAIGPDYLEGNRQVAEAAEQFPGRIVPYITINPNYPLEEIRAEIQHWHESTGIKGFKRKVAREYEQYYLDLAGSVLLYGGLETMVERAGAEKILFGTDVPFIDPRPGLGRILCARISDDDKRKILGLNAKRLFDL